MNNTEVFCTRHKLQLPKAKYLVDPDTWGKLLAGDAETWRAMFDENAPQSRQDARRGEDEAKVGSEVK